MKRVQVRCVCIEKKLRCLFSVVGAGTQRTVSGRSILSSHPSGSNISQAESITSTASAKKGA
jgi:hypothetical protein